MIPYGKHRIIQADIDAVARVLESDWLTQGPAVEIFESKITDYCGAKHGIAVCNATAALYLAYRALELGPGDIFWTVPNTFVATSNAALICGAMIDFVDIDPQTYNISLLDLEKKLHYANKRGQLPKILAPVHFSGQSCPMQEIKQLSNQYGFSIVEDASHAIGGQYLNEPVGNCKFSDITVFSFHPVKIITTGEGGMAVTNSTSLAEKMKLLRNHGITRSPHEMTRSIDGPWYYQQLDLSLNYRITDIQAALGSSQIDRIDRMVAKRGELASRYDAALCNINVVLPHRDQHALSSWHLYVVKIEANDLGLSRHRIFCSMREAGIGVNVHYIPIHTQPYYETLGFHHGDFPVAEKYYENAITLPLYPELSHSEQNYIVETLMHLLSL